MDNRRSVPPAARHRRTRGAGVVQATYPTFRLQPAPPAGFGLPIGRVGALAVALGVGLAVGTSLGAGTAHADDTSAGTESATAASDKTESDKAESPDSADDSDRAGDTTPASGDDDESDEDTDTTESGDISAPDPDDTETDDPGPSESTIVEPAPAERDDRDGADPAPRTESVSHTTALTSAGSPHAGETHSAEILSVEPVDPSAEPDTAAPAPRLTAPDPVATTAACATCSGAVAAHATLTTPVEVSVTPVVTVHSVLSIAQKLLAAFLNPPGGTAEPGLLWVALAWARREIEHTFFNRAPRIEDQEITLALGPGDTSLPIDLGATDHEGDTLTYRVPGSGECAPDHGTVSVDQATGTLVYTPTDPDFTGTDIFTVTVSDGMRGFHLHGPLGWLFKRYHGHTDTAVITIHLNPDGTPTTTVTPVVVGDTLTTAEDTSGGGNVLTNDTARGDDGSTAPGATALVASLAVGPAHGQVILYGDGTYTYIPDADYHGTDSFTYTATSTGAGGGASATATVTVIVTPVNDAPTGLAGQSGFGAEDTTFGGQLLAGDIDSAASGLAYAVSGQAQHGAVTVSPTGTWSYTPDPNYTGADSFTFTVSDGSSVSAPTLVTVMVNPVYDPPAGDPATASGEEDHDITGRLTGTGDDLTFTVDSSPTHGSVSIDPSGSWTYTPDPDFHGVDSFTFTVDDGRSISDAVTVTVTVDPVNDDPVAHAGSAVATEDGGSITGSFDFDDADLGDSTPDQLTVSVTAPAGGTVSVFPDGTGYTYVAMPDFHGIDTFTYTVTDSAGAQSSATITIVVTAVNDRPIATSGLAGTVAEDAVDGVGGTLAGTDVDGDPLTYSLSVQAEHGFVTVDGATGAWTYTPDPDFHGIDTFGFTVDDGTLISAPVEVTVTVAAVNDPPVVGDTLSVSTAEDHQLTIPRAALPVDDADGDALTITLLGAPGHGTVTVDANGAFVYRPDADFHGVDSFTYTVSDGHGGTATAGVSVVVTSVPDAPVANPDTVTAGTGSTLIDTTDLLANDTDGDADDLIVIIVDHPTNGSLLDNGDGTFTYMPDDGHSGPDTFTYLASDGSLVSPTTVVTITVGTLV